MNSDELATLLEGFAARVRIEPPQSASVDKESHSAEVPDGSPFARREATGGAIVRIEIVWL